MPVVQSAAPRADAHLPFQPPASSAQVHNLDLKPKAAMVVQRGESTSPNSSKTSTSTVITRPTVVRRAHTAEPSALSSMASLDARLEKLSMCTPSRLREAQPSERSERSERGGASRAGKPRRTPPTLSRGSSYSRLRLDRLEVAQKTTPRSSILSTAASSNRSAARGRGGRGDLPESTMGKDLDARMRKFIEDGKHAMNALGTTTRPKSIVPSAAMMQVLKTRAKEQAVVHAEATKKQAEYLVSASFGHNTGPVAGPASRSIDRRRRRLSCGVDAGLSFEALTQVWAERGRVDDLFRPENNEVGYVEPASYELVTGVLAKQENKRVQDLLRKHASGPKPKATVPRTPRITISERVHSKKKGSKSLLTKKELAAAAACPLGMQNNSAVWDGTLSLRLRDKAPRTNRGGPRPTREMPTSPEM